MRKTSRLLMSVVLAGAFMACGSSTTGEANYQVIPLPQEVSATEGQPFEITPKTKVVFTEGNDLMERNAQFMADYLNLASITSNPTDEKVIELA
ncbi:MAG: hypothetical protein GX921_05365, partial [Bacteroidales bacterium]|nr:hypothetical protein [Bacteroidales bacterium]